MSKTTKKPIVRKAEQTAADLRSCASRLVNFAAELNAMAQVMDDSNFQAISFDGTGAFDRGIQPIQLFVEKAQQQIAAMQLRERIERIGR